MAVVLFGSFIMVGSQIREGNSILSEFTCQWSHSSCWCQYSFFSLLVDILPLFKLGRNSFHVLCNGRMVVEGWRKVGECNILMEKVSAGFSVLMTPITCGLLENT